MVTARKFEVLLSLGFIWNSEEETNKQTKNPQQTCSGFL